MKEIDKNNQAPFIKKISNFSRFGIEMDQQSMAVNVSATGKLTHTPKVNELQLVRYAK